LFDLSGKTAVITGSSRGIGRAIAERMAEHGARVVISSRKPGPCEEAAGEINARYGEGRAIAVPANISSKAELQTLVDRTMEAFGRIDILVCNAATNPYFGPLGGITDEQFLKILTNNVLANNWLIGMVSPQMLERRDGAIIIISSIGGLRGSPVIGAYNISKAADFQLARNLAVEFGPVQRAGELHRPGADPDRLRPRAVGEPRDPEADHRGHAAPPHRQPDEIAGAACSWPRRPAAT
jgi:NAD(P)-dependent dehydrogenase (short-subunit alcohol dehydrogenase family)